MRIAGPHELAKAMAYARSLHSRGSDWRLLRPGAGIPTGPQRYRPAMRQEFLSGHPLLLVGDDFRKRWGNGWIVMFDGAYVLSYYKTNVTTSAAYAAARRLH